MKSIGVVGIGVVGGAVCHLFGTNGYKVTKYDKYKNLGKRDAINKCDVVFICVPTPFKNGKVDISAVEECVSWIKAKNIVIKSTVPPGTTRRLAEKYKKVILHNPEFLREKTAKADIFTEGRILIGCLQSTFGQAYLLKSLYEKILPDSSFDVHLMIAEESELIKYATNAFLATKVAFCNEIDLIARKYRLTWNCMRPYILLDKRIGESHTVVTEERGFGGTCLPKDLDGLISFSNSKFFKAVKEQNIRTKKYDKIPQGKHT